MGALGIDAFQSQRFLISRHSRHHRQQQQQQLHGYGFDFGSSCSSSVNNSPSSSFFSAAGATAAAAATPLDSLGVVAQGGHGRGGRCGTSYSIPYSSQVVRLPSLSPSPSPSSASRKCSCTPRAGSSSSSTRDRHLRTTTAFNWVFLNSHSFPTSPSPSSSSSPLPQWGNSKLRATAVSGNWALPSSSSSCCSSSSSDAPNLDELLLVVARRWRPTHNSKKGKLLLSVPTTISTTATTTPFQLWPLTREQGSENLVCEILKLSILPIFSWLRNQQRRIWDIMPDNIRLSRPNNPRHWGSSGALLDRSLLPFESFSSSNCLAGGTKSISFNECTYGYQRMWAIRATSDYCNGGSSKIRSSSSQAEGQAAASLEEGVARGAALFAQQQQQQQRHHYHQKRCPDRRRRGLEFLATGYGWRVRDAERGELRELIRVADIQSDAFHERSPLLDDLFAKIFHAEVLSSLQYKARNFDPNRYACLLAEVDVPKDSMDEEGNEATIVGAVDITVLDDGNVLSHLPGADEYLYISGMAVDPEYRRQGVATLLLEACVARAMEWTFTYLVLHAYEDDFRARSLYSRAGYHVISADPAWMTKFLGRRRRVVMAKKIARNDDEGNLDAGDDEIPDLHVT